MMSCYDYDYFWLRFMNMDINFGNAVREKACKRLRTVANGLFVLL